MCWLTSAHSGYLSELKAFGVATWACGSLHELYKSIEASLMDIHSKIVEAMHVTASHFSRAHALALNNEKTRDVTSTLEDLQTSQRESHIPLCP